MVVKSVTDVLLLRVLLDKDQPEVLMTLATVGIAVPSAMFHILQVAVPVSAAIVVPTMVQA